MAKSGSGSAIITTNSIGGGMFSTGKRAKQHVGIDCTPEGAFGLAIGLIVVTLALHFLSRIFK